MATFVLVPGGWHGGWYFEPLARALRADGHEAHAVTLTGVGSRHHLSGASVNLDTHVRDVVAFLEAEDIRDAILCGHSYGGMVITGAAESAPERVKGLVYVDAYVPADGDSCWSLATDAFRALFLGAAARDGYSVQPPSRLDSRATSHPLASFLQAIHLTGRADGIQRRAYIYLSAWEGSPFDSTFERVRQDPAWTTHTLHTNHNVMANAADQLLAILMRFATEA